MGLLLCAGRRRRPLIRTPAGRATPLKAYYIELYRLTCAEELSRAVTLWATSVRLATRYVWHCRDSCRSGERGSSFCRSRATPPRCFLFGSSSHSRGAEAFCRPAPSMSRRIRNRAASGPDDFVELIEKHEHIAPPGGLAATGASWSIPEYDEKKEPWQGAVEEVGRWCRARNCFVVERLLGGSHRLREAAAGSAHRSCLAQPPGPRKVVWKRVIAWLSNLTSTTLIPSGRRRPTRSQAHFRHCRRRSERGKNCEMVIGSRFLNTENPRTVVWQGGWCRAWVFSFSGPFCAHIRGSARERFRTSGFVGVMKSARCVLACVSLGIPGNESWSVLQRRRFRFWRFPAASASAARAGAYHCRVLRDPLFRYTYFVIALP